MSEVSREQPWSIISTIGKYSFVRMLQNCHKSNSCLHEWRKALHLCSESFQGIRVYLILVLVWGLARTGVCPGEGRRIVRRCMLTSPLSEWERWFWIHTAHHLDRDHHRALAVWIKGIAAIQWQQMYTQQDWLDFARYKVDPKFSQKGKKKVLGSRWIFSLVVKFLSTWVISKDFAI